MWVTHLLYLFNFEQGVHRHWSWNILQSSGLLTQITVPAQLLDTGGCSQNQNVINQHNI